MDTLATGPEGVEGAAAAAAASTGGVLEAAGVLRLRPATVGASDFVAAELADAEVD